MNGKNSQRGQKNDDPHRINERITAPMVRVVGENVDNEIHSIKDALKIADEMGLDLVEISPNANPPVCKLMDYKKFLFDQKKKQKEIKAKATKVVVKEIRLGPQTDDHDFEFKLNHAKRFLEEGAKDVNIESMLVLNSSRFQIDLETYTYYQLKAQYSTLYREQVSMMYNIARPHAKDVPMINFAEELDIHDNPFSFDKMFRVDNGKMGD